MNQSKTKALKSLFNRLDIFPAGDPRLKAAWRRAKAGYNKQPSSKRAAYLKRIASEVALAETLIAKA